MRDPPIITEKDRLYAWKDARDSTQNLMSETGKVLGMLKDIESKPGSVDDHDAVYEQLKELSAAHMRMMLSIGALKELDT